MYLCVIGTVAMKFIGRRNGCRVAIHILES